MRTIPKDAVATHRRLYKPLLSLQPIRALTSTLPKFSSKTSPLVLLKAVPKVPPSAWPRPFHLEEICPILQPGETYPSHALQTLSNAHVFSLDDTDTDRP